MKRIAKMVAGQVEVLDSKLRLNFMSMANIIRSAKSGSDWTFNELDAYNVKISFQNSPTFFHVSALLEPTVDREILTTLSADNTATEDSYTLLTQLDQAMFSDERDESAVHDFVVTLFRVLGYAHRPRIIHTRKEMRLLVCGEYRFTKADIVIIDKNQNGVILLVQEDEHFGGYLSDPLAQLVAEATSAFQSNNLRRLASGLDPLGNKVIPGIIMVGTSPTFFKTPVTTELAQCVQRGDYPATPTVVFGHMPEIPRPTHRQSEGMKPLDNGRIMLQCYEAFKQFIV